MTLTIGVDIGGTKIAAGLVDEAGHVVRRGRRETPALSSTAVVAAIVEVIGELAGSAEAAAGGVAGVGLGAAGFVDESRRVVRFASNLDWREEPLAATVSEAVDLPVVVENDANAAAWGEFRFGAGAEARSLVAVTVGTGVGGGLVLDGGLVRGAHGMAAEIGHMTQVPGGRACGCGRHGCWEQYASGNALLREARGLAAERRSEAGTLLALGDGTPEGVVGRHVTEAARRDDPVALEAFARVGAALGTGIADLVALLDPELVVLGGGVSEAGDLLLAPTRSAFEESLVARAHRPLADIVLATLGNDAGLVGVADLARES
jgi:glucokinase